MAGLAPARSCIALGIVSRRGRAIGSAEPSDTALAQLGHGNTGDAEAFRAGHRHRGARMEGVALGPRARDRCPASGWCPLRA